MRGVVARRIRKQVARRYMAGLILPGDLRRVYRQAKRAYKKESAS